MLDFIRSNLLNILAIVFLAYILILSINKQWETSHAMACKYILQAERTMPGSGKGKERFDFVYNKVYSRIPQWLQFFMDQDDMKTRLQEWYDDIKEHVERN